VAQTETGVVEEPGNVVGNVVDVKASTEPGMCDFDGDGFPDSFMTTGATWWYDSRGSMRWVYLHTSTKRLSDPLSPMTVQDVTGDNTCDVVVDGIVYPGGKPKSQLGKVTAQPIPPGGGVAK
jgi:hypothetical protein